MRILITGASGFIGNHLACALKELGHEIVACVRNIKEYERYHPGIDVVECDFSLDTCMETWIVRLTGVDSVINTVGIIREKGRQRFDTLHRQTPIALFKACEQVGVRKVIQISALGADETAFSQYHLTKRAADKFLMSLDLKWIIAMPSIVYGPGEKSMSFFKAMAALPMTPLLGKGQQAIQPIHINDFTTAMLTLLTPGAPSHITVPLVGPAPITMKELFSLLKGWLGIRKIRFIGISYQLALATSWIGKLIPDSPITKESIQMLKTGNTAEASLFIKMFGFKPSSVHESLAHSPAQQADRWHARLLFLRPLLRLSIAFVWIYTGFISIFVYPIESSYKLLAQLGIGESAVPITLYGAAILDFLLGIATLLGYRLKIIGIAQIILIISYTILITLFLPEYWIHPFGPISKNIPLVISILIMISIENNHGISSD